MISDMVEIGNGQMQRTAELPGLGEWIADCGTKIRGRQLLGNKGVRLVEMYQLGFPVPEFFIVTSKAPVQEMPLELAHAINMEMQRVGCSVSVRSSAAHSMPGMMKTFLDIRDFEGVAAAIRQVADSWHSYRARWYREYKGISHDLGTAIIVQRMVYGAGNANSGTGVVFSRCPMTGQRALWGDYLPMAKGEAVVSGSETPERLTEQHPFWAELREYARRLEWLYRAVQDIEFTVEDGKLWLLQTRDAKLHEQAVVPVLRGLLEDGILGHMEAIERWCSFYHRTSLRRQG